MAYYRIEPWGEERADLRNGMLCSLVANMFRKRGKRAAQPKDFMPKFERGQKKKMSDEAIVSTLRNITQQHAAVFGRKR